MSGPERRRHDAKESDSKELDAKSATSLAAAEDDDEDVEMAIAGHGQGHRTGAGLRGDQTNDTASGCMGACWTCGTLRRTDTYELVQQQARRSGERVLVCNPVHEPCRPLRCEFCGASAPDALRCDWLSVSTATPDAVHSAAEWCCPRCFLVHRPRRLTDPRPAPPPLRASPLVVGQLLAAALGLGNH